MSRPEYCEALDEDEFPDEPCPACGATVAGNDKVRGICQALKNRPRPQPLIHIVLIDKRTEEIVAATPPLSGLERTQAHEIRPSRTP